MYIDLLSLNKYLNKYLFIYLNTFVRLFQTSLKCISDVQLK